MINMKDSLHGKRYILLVQSVCGHGKNSTGQQIERLQEFATRKGLCVLGKLRVGTQSTQSPSIPELDALLRRKLEKDDIDLLVIANLSRLGRGRIATLIHTLTRFHEAGLGLITLDKGRIDLAMFATFLSFARE